MPRCKVCGLDVPSGTWRNGEFLCDEHERATVNLVLDVAVDVALRKIPLEAALAKRKKAMEDLKIDEDYLLRMVFMRLQRFGL